MTANYETLNNTYNDVFSKWKEERNERKKLERQNSELQEKLEKITKSKSRNNSPLKMTGSGLKNISF